MVRHQFVLALALAVGLLCALSFAATGANAPAARYTLIMSENDALCRPLLDFYNAHVSDDDDYEAGYIEDRFNSDLQPPGPVLLIGNHPWQEYGLLLWQEEIFPALNIYNDGRPRTVIIRDFGLNVYFVTFQSQLMVTKPGKNMPARKLASYDEKDPAFELSVDFTEGGVSPNGTDDSHVYYLRKYPGLAQLFEQSEDEAQRLRENRYISHLTDVPMIGQSVAQRVVVLAGYVFITARERIKEPQSHIIVYALRSDALIHDTCYFELRRVSGS
jgi:hypothetical protein